MIFLTVGTELPFDRLVKAVDQWCEINKQVEIFGQIGQPGPDGYQPDHFEWQNFIAPELYKEKYESADLIIAHAGMGSIITALVQGKPILILPRKAELREHRNDHQLATAQQFANRAGIFVAEEESQIASLLDQWETLQKTLDMQKASPYAEERLLKTLKDFIFESS